MKTILFTALALSALPVAAQSPAKVPANPAPAPAYGAPISLENAKRIVAAPEAYAASKQYTVAIAIVDAGGNLVMLEKLDNTQIGSLDVAIGKAKTSNNFKRPTKALEDALAGGAAGLRVLALPVYPVEGGEIILSADGKVIGAIGVSGMSSAQDDEVAKAGIAVNK
jgi:glc operon protein GlcG